MYWFQVFRRIRKNIYLDLRRISIRPAVASSLMWWDNVALEIGISALNAMQEISSRADAMRSRISNLLASTSALVIRRNRLLFIHE